MKDLVSVIIPVYNTEKYLEETLQSVLRQTYSYWEMIIVNDGSTDGSIDIIDKYLKQDERIKLINLDQKFGIAKARNIGINASRGRYIAFLDSDDIWVKEKLTKQVKFMKRNDYAFSFTGNGYMNAKGQVSRRKYQVPKRVQYHDMLGGNRIHCLTVMIDRYKIDVHMPDIKHEDYAAWLKILKAGHTAYGINEILSYYRIVKFSTSANKFKSLIWTFKIFYDTENIGLIKSITGTFRYIYHGILKRVR